MRVGDAAGEDGAADQYHYNVGEQLHLLALDPLRAAEAHRHRRYHPNGCDEEKSLDRPEYREVPAQTFDANGIGDPSTGNFVHGKGVH